MEVAEWSRDVSSGESCISEQQSVEHSEGFTLDSDKLDHHLIYPESLVCFAIHLHLATDLATGNEDWCAQTGGDAHL